MVAKEEEISKREKRKYTRTELDMDAKFSSNYGPEECGRIRNISESGLYMMSKAEAAIGDQIIAFPPGLGRIVGVVVRVDKAGFAVRLNLSDKQRTYLKKRIDAVVAGVPYFRVSEQRANSRMPLGIEAAAEIVPTGEVFQCKVLDISKTGAAIESDRHPAIGAEIKIGVIYGRVYRITDYGFVIQFEAQPVEVEGSRQVHELKAVVDKLKNAPDGKD